jgi:hypothetical protein
MFEIVFALLLNRISIVIHLCSVSFIACIVLYAVFCLSGVLFCVMCVICVVSYCSITAIG